MKLVRLLTRCVVDRLPLDEWVELVKFFHMLLKRSLPHRYTATTIIITIGSDLTGPLPDTRRSLDTPATDEGFAPLLVNLVG